MSIVQTGREFFGKKKETAGKKLRKPVTTFLIFLILSFSQSYAQQSTTECDEVLVLLQVKHMGSIQLPSIICGEEIYLSVTDLFDFLKIRNIPAKDFSSVQGHFLNQDDTFFIDEPNLEITYKNKSFSLEPGDIIRTRTRLFLKSKYFEELFSLKTSFTFYDLSVALESEFELPSIKAARREQMRANLRKVKQEFTADTTIERNHPFFHFGKANWAINTTQNTKLSNHNRFNLSLGGLLAGGEFSGSFNYNTNQEFLPRNQFYRWRYVNNDNKALRQVSLGKINKNSIASIFSPVVGVQLTNTPTYVRKSFGTYVLSDYTEPEWMVELYINNVLVDYVQADASGFFSFDVPLVYGGNALELRYFGPWGEERLSQQNLSIPFNFLPPNKFEYTISSGMVEDGGNSIFSQARFNYGLSRNLTLGGGMEYFSSLERNSIIPFFNTSMRLPYNLLFFGEYSHNVGYKGILNYTSPSNVRLEINYTKYDEAQDAVRFSYTEERKAMLSVPIKARNFSGLSRLIFRQNFYGNNRYTNADLLFSGSMLGLNFNLTTTAFLSSFNDPLIYSRFSTSIRLPKGFTLVPQLTYEYSSNRLTSLRGQFKKQLFKKAHVQASYDHNFKYDQYSVQFGFTYELPFSRVGAFASASKRHTSISQSAGGSMTFEPKSNYLEFNNTPDLGRGGLKFLPFLDINGNGTRDQLEPVVEGLKVQTTGGAIREKTAVGATIITGLEPYIPYHFILNTDNLNRIAWKIENQTLNISVNPNQLKLIEIPVSVVGEVAGFVYLEQNNSLDGLGGIEVNIYNKDEKLVQKLISEPDGFFSFLGLKSGTYKAQVETAQMKNLELTASDSIIFDLVNTKEGDIVDNLEFRLKEISVEQTNP